MQNRRLNNIHLKLKAICASGLGFMKISPKHIRWDPMQSLCKWKTFSFIYARNGGILRHFLLLTVAPEAHDLLF